MEHRYFIIGENTPMATLTDFIDSLNNGGEIVSTKETCDTVHYVVKIKKG